MYVTKRTRWDLDYEWTPEFSDVEMSESEFFGLIDDAQADGWEDDGNPFRAVWQFRKRNEETGLYDFLQISYDPYREEE